MNLAHSKHAQVEIAEAATDNPPSMPAAAGQVQPADSAQLISFDDYAAYRPNLIPSPAAGKWFLRKHARELVEAGMLFRICGRYMVQPRQMDAFMLRLGQRIAVKVVGGR